MKLAFSQNTATPAQADLLRRRFAACGYDGLQLKADQYRGYLEEPNRFLDHWPETGVASALIAGGKLDTAHQAQWPVLLRFAQAVGTQRIVFCHSLKREDVSSDDIKRFAATLSEWAAQARDHGVALSLHHHFNQPVMHREDMDVFFGEARGVGLTIDTAHLVKSGILDIAGTIERFAHVIDNFHLKDFAEGQWRLLGQGVIDFAPVFAAIRRIGFDGWVSADEESGAEVLESMRHCLAVMRVGLGFPTSIIRGAEASVTAAPWGTLQWLAGSHSPETGMTVGRVTIKPGQANPLHLHPNCDEVLFVVRGRLEHTLPEGGSTTLEPGDCICLPRHAAHQARNIGNDEAEVMVCFNDAHRQTVMLENGADGNKGA